MLLLLTDCGKLRLCFAGGSPKQVALLTVRGVSLADVLQAYPLMHGHNYKSMLLSVRLISLIDLSTSLISFDSVIVVGI